MVSIFFFFFCFTIKDDMHHSEMGSMRGCIMRGREHSSSVEWDLLLEDGYWTVTLNLRTRKSDSVMDR